MSIYTPGNKYLLAVIALLLTLLGGAVQAQTQPPTVNDPAVQDPTYPARKASLVQQTPATAAAPQVARSISPTSRALPSCFEPLDKTTYTPVSRNDDGSLGPIQLGFQFFLFGTPYTQVYINTNGNITFNSPLTAFSASGFPNTVPMIAPFWADVDTRTPTSGDRGKVWYRLYNDRLVVTWDSVGYYSNRINLKNNFQVTIYANAGGNLAQDVVFAYGDMQWTTGEASGGAGGLGGTPANVGVNEGFGTNRFIQVGRFNLPDASHPNNTANSGVDYLDYQCFGYRVFDTGNLPPAVAGLPTSGAITVNQGETVTVAPQFTGPEPNQVVTVAVNTGGMCNTLAPIGSGNNPVVNLSVTGGPCNIGTHTVTFTAQDNGTPTATSTFTLTVIVNPPVNAAIWDGDVSTDYLTAQNWQGDVLPQPADSVRIPAVAPRFPLLTGTAMASCFVVEAGASMTVGTGGALTLSGHLRSAGTFSSQGLLELQGTVRQNVGGVNGVIVGELWVGPAGAMLTGPLAVRRVLDLTGALTTNGFSCTLLSDATATAMVVNRGTGRVVGNATVQRYISPSLNPGRGYRHFSSPVTGTTVNVLAGGGYLPVVNPAYNTLGNAAQPFPTVFGYDQARVTSSGTAGSADFDKGFFSPSTLSTAFADGKGYAVNIPAMAAPINFTGALHNGSYNSGALPRGTQTESGWHLLGNPYPSPLDWAEAFSGASGLDNAVYVFKSSGPYAGSYDSYVNGIGSARYIGVAQGFFVHTATPGVSGQLNLTNNARVNSYSSPTFNRTTTGTGTKDQRPQLRLDLTSNGQTDATYVYFESGATPGFDQQYDAFKLAGGSQLYLATGTGSPAFGINGLPALTAAGAAIPLMTYLPQAGSFGLSAGSVENFGTASLQLEDRQTGLWHDLRQQPTLTFQVSRPDEAATRFVLHVNQARALATSAATLAADAVSLWPNPASESINLTVAGLAAGADNLQLVLLNTMGQAVSQQTVPVQTGRATTTLDVRTLPAGVYILKGSTRTKTFARSVIVR